MKIQENELPCYYIDSDNASKRAQNVYKRITWGALILMFISTILVSLASSITTQISNFDKINGVILFASGTISLFLAYTKPERNWYLGRAIAESIKTLSWRYMMHAEPFQPDDKNLDLKIFIERIEAINKQANEDRFIPKPNKKHSDIITKKMEEIRSFDFLERKSYYATNRIDDQIKWYGDKSESNRCYANICSFLIIAFQFIAAIYLFQFFDKIKIINLNNIMVFLATSIIGVIEMNKYKELFQSYGFTKQELNIIRTKFGTVNSDEELNRFVLEAEQAISREHTTWLARRSSSHY
ncbi:DUF4231 domain-containing protein [Mucilaginibacter sp.]|uniref:DUF4231 domain-containing protein n=1 Tax=Mucilaginibacter sp. TaxID=1882438 RepID=UPI0025DEEA4C|nr:DUF4231 domain-containing protein [Mucilaginibacter sp.]